VSDVQSRTERSFSEMVARANAKSGVRGIKVGSEWVRRGRGHMRCRVVAVEESRLPSQAPFARVDWERLDPVKKKRDWAVALWFLRHWEPADA
jgi:hypothetical protein